MEKLTAWLSDKKNLPIVVAGVSIVLILAVLFMLKMTGTIGGGGGGGEIMPDMGMPQPGVPDPGVPGAPPAGPVTPTPGAPGPGLQTAGPVPGATAAVMPPMLPYRKDPFLPLTGLPTKQDVMAMMLPALRRPRIAPAPVPPPPPEGGVTVTEVLPPQPFRRMAGVLWNGKVSAILETNGETDIVRPGSEITRGNSKARVERIEQDCIILKSLDTNTPYYIRVSMRGAVTGPNAPGQDQNQMISGGNPGEM